MAVFIVNSIQFKPYLKYFILYQSHRFLFLVDPSESKYNKNISVSGNLECRRSLNQKACW